MPESDPFEKSYKPHYFYYKDGKPTVTLIFDPDEHAYCRRMDDGSLIPQDGVTNTVHIIDKSPALIPWAAKMVAEKAIRLWGNHEVKALTVPEFTALMMDAKTAPRDKLVEAGDIGHLAHECLEASIKQAIYMNAGVIFKIVNMPEDERAQNCVNAALKWMESHNVRWLETEKKVYSLEYRYAGTMDGLCYVDSCADPLCCPKPAKGSLAIADWKSSNQLYIEFRYQTAAYERAFEEESGVDITDRFILRLGKYDGEFESWHLTADDYIADMTGFLRCLALKRQHELVKDRMSAARKAKTAAKREVVRAEKEANKKKKIDKTEKA